MWSGCGVPHGHQLVLQSGRVGVLAAPRAWLCGVSNRLDTALFEAGFEPHPQWDAKQVEALILQANWDPGKDTNMLEQLLTISFTYRPHPFQCLSAEKCYCFHSNIFVLEIADDPAWALVSVDRFRRDREGSRKVVPLPACPAPSRPASAYSDDPPTFAEVIQHITHSNFVNLWREGFKMRNREVDAHGKQGKPSVSSNGGIDYDVALLEVMQRLYPDCPVLYTGKEDSSGNDPLITKATTHEGLKKKQENERNSERHICEAHFIVISAEEICLFRPFKKYSVENALRFSPALIEDSPTKSLFILFQILLGMKEVHNLGLTVGDLTLHSHVYMEQNFYVVIRPDIERNLVPVSVGPSEGARNFLHMAEPCRDLLALMQKAMKRALDTGDQGQLEVTHQNCLGYLVKAWVSGKLSNLDYILFLNYLCGRNFSNPNYYPFVPWVSTFSSENGGWRDLSKSKFRLNKGDPQLDLTYNSLLELQQLGDDHPSEPSGNNGVQQSPHHVTDVLSEITYYVYKARITPQSVLCKHVRNRWVPAEYPSSMQRLQAWTPDECIPEFYTDPSIFKSIHSDLTDLEIPSWCESPEAFIKWHRAALESSYVSERLHHWIDFTFGYKLTGGSAVRAKNVCLNLVDNHIDLRLNGVVQLFQHAHPARETPSPFWSKTAPKLDTVIYRDNPRNKSLAVLSQDVDTLSSSASTSSLNQLSEQKIRLPRDYEPAFKLSELESVNAFVAKNLSEEGDVLSSPVPEDKATPMTSIAKELATRRIVRDMQVLGCLILELFLPKRFLCLGETASLKSRFSLARKIIQYEAQSVPLYLRQVIDTLLGHKFNIESSDRYPSVSGFGLPPPSAYQLLAPSVSVLPFPSSFRTMSKVLRTLQHLSNMEKSCLSAAAAGDRVDTPSIIQKVAEFKVKIVVSQLQGFWEQVTEDELILILPTIQKLLDCPDTAIQAAWFLFEPFARALGPFLSRKYLLHAIISIYEGNVQTSKHLKLYHRTFLQFLIVRLGTRAFLRYFSIYLVEAVGGYKDYEDADRKSTREGLERTWLTFSTSSNLLPPCQDGSQNMETRAPAEEAEEEQAVEDAYNSSSSSSETEETHRDDSLAEGEVFAFDSVSLDDSKGLETEAPLAKSSPKQTAGLEGDILIPQCKLDDSDEEDNGEEDNLGNISQVASESVLWLAHRIGPVLTAKYLTRNLLRMLNLCYIGPDSLKTVTSRFPESAIRVGRRKGRVTGDILAQKVLECLSEVAGLYGDQVILLQYLPYIWDLISSCKKRLTPNHEGGLLGAMALLHHILPYVTDSVLMNELPESLLANILYPMLQMVISRSTSFKGGYRSRQALLYKVLDVTYLIGLRIGEEMARSHLTMLSSALFSAFEKIYENDGKLKPYSNEPAERHIVQELAQVLSAEMAYGAYLAFYNLLGRAELEESIINLDVIRSLCLLQQDATSHAATVHRPATFACLRGFDAQQSSQGEIMHSSSGNQISGNSLANTVQGNSDLHHLISRELATSSERYLKGNWLAYWEHELGRPDSHMDFTLKQIKLQSFQGHVGGIKALHMLDNENSFLSGSRDKTVKVWSLRNSGEGSLPVGCKWTYNLHKKSVFSVTFLENLQLAVSCDSTVHVWDPFIGSGVHQVDSVRLGLVHAMTTVPAPSPHVIVATQDSLLHLIDCRVGHVVTDLKVSVGSSGLVRCIRGATNEPNTVLVGHTSGYISVLDLRSGKLKQSWKAHEGEILTLTCLDRGSEFISTSLDQTVSVWNWADGKLKSGLPGAQEPVHCVGTLSGSDNIVTGSTANRIGVRHGTTSEAPFISSKLRPDLVKGNLSALTVLQLNRLLLLGQDNGALTLIC